MIKYFFQSSFVWQENGNCFLVRLHGDKVKIEEIVANNTNDWWDWVGAAVVTATGAMVLPGLELMSVGFTASDHSTCNPFEIGDFAQSRGGALISAPKAQNGWITVGYKDGHRVIESTWGIPGKFLAIGAPLQGSYHKWYQATPYTGTYTPTSASDGTGWLDISGNKGDTLGGGGSGGYDQGENAKWLGLFDFDFSDGVKPEHLLAFALIAGLTFGGIALYKRSQ